MKPHRYRLRKNPRPQRAFSSQLAGCIHIFHSSQKMFGIASIAQGFLLIFQAYFSHDTASSSLSVFVYVFLYTSLCLSLCQSLGHLYQCLLLFTTWKRDIPINQATDSPTFQDHRAFTLVLLCDIIHINYLTALSLLLFIFMQM